MNTIRQQVSDSLATGWKVDTRTQLIVEAADNRLDKPWTLITNWPVVHESRRFFKKRPRAVQRIVYGNLLREMMTWEDPNYDKLLDFYVLREMLTGREMKFTHPKDHPGFIHQELIKKEVSQITGLSPKTRGKKTRNRRKNKKAGRKSKNTLKKPVLQRGIEEKWSTIDAEKGVGIVHTVVYRTIRQLYGKCARTYG